jgi:hypothetical protein
LIKNWELGGGINGFGWIILLVKFPPFFCQICKDLLIGGGFVNLKGKKRTKKNKKNQNKKRWQKGAFG